MPLVLGIETATDVCSVALLDDEGRVDVDTLDEPRRHAERLVPMIDACLRAAGRKPSDLDAVAVSAGPGSYTGLRIGMATAKGLAEGIGIPIVAVPSLAALALAAADHPQAPRPASTAAGALSHIATSFRSRRNEVYAALYRIDREGWPVEIAAPAAGAPDAVAASWPAGHFLLVGEGAPLLAPVLGTRATAVEPEVRPDAGAVVRLGARLLAQGAGVDGRHLEPYYLKDFVARAASRSVYERLPYPD